MALSWFESYLSDRTQSVMADCGVFTPALFSLQSQPLSDVIFVYGCGYHNQADDKNLRQCNT